MVSNSSAKFIVVNFLESSWSYIARRHKRICGGGTENGGRQRRKQRIDKNHYEKVKEKEEIDRNKKKKAYEIVSFFSTSTIVPVATESRVISC